MTAPAKTNINVVFGTMTFGKEGAEQARVHSLPECQSILEVFKQHGHTELDTARMYGGGSSEEYLQQLGVEKQGFKVATKVYPSARSSGAKGWSSYDHSASGVERALTDSLTALGTSSVDLYYLHAPDREVPLEETLRTIDSQHRAGKFQRFGISNYTADEVERIATLCKENGWVKPSVYQGLYNCITRAAEGELIPVLRKHGIAYYTYNPLLGGLLSGKKLRKEDDDVEEGSRFDPNRWQGQMYRKRYYRPEYFRALELIHSAASSANLSMGEVALRWMQHHSALDRQHGDAIIIGASSLNHIGQNLADFEKGPLPADVVKAVDEAWKVVEPNAPPYHF